MMPALLRDSTNDARCLCWFFADSVNDRFIRSDRCIITTKRLKISSRKTPAARSRYQSCPRYETKSASPLSRFITRAPEPAAKSP
jgi:hypothetical protein